MTAAQEAAKDNADATAPQTLAQLPEQPPLLNGASSPTMSRTALEELVRRDEPMEEGSAHAAEGRSARSNGPTELPMTEVAQLYICAQQHSEPTGSQPASQEITRDEAEAYRTLLNTQDAQMRYRATSVAEKNRLLNAKTHKDAQEVLTKLYDNVRKAQVERKLSAIRQRRQESIIPAPRKKSTPSALL